MIILKIIRSHATKLKVHQPVISIGKNVAKIITKAHSLGARTTQPACHSSFACRQWSGQKISKCQLQSIIIRMPSVKTIPHRMPTIIILKNTKNDLNRHPLYRLQLILTIQPFVKKVLNFDYFFLLQSFPRFLA